MDQRIDWIAGVRAVVGLLVGAGVVWGWLAFASATPPGPGRTVCWVADRDGGRVVGMDRELFVTGEHAVPWPVELEAAAGGALWVARAAEADPRGEHRILRIERDGARSRELVLGPVLDLSATPDGGALVVEDRPGAGGRVLRFARDTALLWSVPCAGARSAAGDERVLVGTAEGELVLLHGGTGERRTSTRLEGEVADVGRAERAGWFALELGGRVLRLDPSLRVEWAASAGLDARHLAVEPGGRRAWLASFSQATARRFGARGALELEVELPLLGLDRVEALEGGGAWIAAPGALFEVDGEGELRRSQGGFDFLVDVAGVKG